MAKTFSVQIPTSPYLKQFIKAEFGEPIPINNYNLVGVFLIGVLQKENFNTRLPNEKKDFRYTRFTTAVTCVAPITLIRNFGFALNADATIQINRFFEEYFDRELYLFVKRNTDPGKRYAGYKQAIEAFAVLHSLDLENTVTFDALKKMESRYRKKIEDKSVATLSPRKKQAAPLFQ